MGLDKHYSAFKHTLRTQRAAASPPWGGLVLWWGRMSSAPEDDQRSEIKLRSKLDGCRKAVDRQGAETGKLFVYEWVVGLAAGWRLLG